MYFNANVSCLNEGFTYMLARHQDWIFCILLSDPLIPRNFLCMQIKVCSALTLHGSLVLFSCTEHVNTN
jgi:hypothetical protein